MPGPSDRTGRAPILSEYDRPERVADVVNQISRGGGVDFQRVDLATSATSTTIDAGGFRAETGVVFVMAQDANARAVSPIVGTLADGSITITHSSSATPGTVGVLWRW